MRQTSSRTRPQENKAPQLSEILSTLSFALDLTEGAVPGHAVRSCLLAMRIAQAMRLSASEQADLYYAALLKDVGCSSNAARMCEIVGGDDRAVKAGVKLEDWTRVRRPKLSTIKLLWNHVLPGESAFNKAMRLLQIAATQADHNREMIELRCDRGASIVSRIGLNAQVAQAVRHLDEHWDGSGYPDRLEGHAVPLLSSILGVAQHLDAFCMQTGPFRAIAVMNERSRRWFDPEIVQATLGLHRAGRLWLFCLPGDGHERAHQAVLGMVPGRAEKLQAASIDQICEAFAEVVDAKSPLTFSHSIGVKDAAMTIGETMGLPKARLDVLRRAALLHDLGKLSVPNTILDKPGKLDAAEFGIIKRHSALTRQILSRMPCFAEIAILAGEHHEKLDGSGYPDGLEARDLSLESRLIAVADVYGALSEHRPYRPALDPDEITRILKEQVPGKLDGRCFEALQAARQARKPPAAPAIPLPLSAKKPPAAAYAAEPPAPVGARA